MSPKDRSIPVTDSPTGIRSSRQQRSRAFRASQGHDQGALARLLILSVLLALMVQPLLTQDLPPGFRKLELPSHGPSNVRGFAQDAEGYIWMIGFQSLYRYDGLSFLEIRSCRNRLNIAVGSYFERLIITRDGFICPSTVQQVLFYQPRTDSLFILDLFDEPDMFGPSPVIIDMAEDTAGRVFILLADSRLILVDPLSQRFPRPDTVLDLRKTGLKGSGTTLESLRSGSMLLGSSNGLSLIVSDGTSIMPAFGSAEPVPYASYDSVIILSPAGDARALVAFGDGSFGMLDMARGSYAKLGRLPRLNPADIHENAHLALDSTGLIWYATTSLGMFKFDRKRGTWEQVHIMKFGDIPLGTDNFPSTFVDRSGLVWIGTARDILTYSPNRTRFYSLSRPTPAQIGHALDNLTGVLVDRQGTLWLGSIGNGIFEQRINSATIRNHLYRPDDPRSLSSNFVIGIHERSNGEIWFGTTQGASVFRPGERGFTRYMHSAGDTSTVGATVVIGAYEDRQGALWVSHYGGVDRYDDATRRFEHVVRWNDSTYHSGGTVTNMLHDSRGYLWMTTAGRGILRLSPDRSHIDRFTNEQVGTSAEAVITYNAVAEDASGTIWIGGKGLLSYEYDRNLFAWHDISFPFPDIDYTVSTTSIMSGSLPVFGVVPISSDTVWFSTEGGVGRYDIRDGTIHVYGASDGVPLIRGRFPGTFRRADGTIMMAGHGGLVWFHPDSIGYVSSSPPVSVARITTIDTSYSPAPHAPGILTLSYRNSSVTFSLAVLDYTMPEKNRIQYRIDNIHDTWKDTEAGFRVTVADLDPGEYVLRVRGATMDGEWGDHEYVLPIVVEAPFWATTFFKSMAAVFFALTLLLAYLAHRSKIRALQNLRFSISSDLHDEIGSDLSAIALEADLAARHTHLPRSEWQEIYALGGKVRQAARKLRDVVWIMDPEQDTVGCLSARIRESCRSLLAGLDASINVSDGDFDQNLTLETKRNLLLMLKEMLNNIVLHARATHAWVDVNFSDRSIHIMVRDDGVGFDLHVVRQGRGLRSLQERARIIGGTLTIESIPGTGTRVRFSGQIAHTWD